MSIYFNTLPAIFTKQSVLMESNLGPLAKRSIILVEPLSTIIFGLTY